MKKPLPPLPPPLQILSLGAGVQSSTLALMAAAGEILPMPDAAIFADTMAEPKSVYVWLDWLEKQLPFPLYRVDNGSLTKAALLMKTTKDGRLYSKTDIPFFTSNHDGGRGMVKNRACTYDHKILPIMRKARELAGVKRGEKRIRVIQWIGISLDEVSRMKPSRDKWAQSRWPLIEKEMRRHDCLRWMQSHDFPEPPRSACVYCPFHNNAEWRRLKYNEPQEFARAVQFEKEIQAIKAKSQNFRTTPYLHVDRVPLDQVDLSTDNERGQGLLAGFNAECEGMCGV